MITTKEECNRILASLSKQEWIKCPLCHEEYNKLRPCSYFNGSERVGTYVCVNCAESVHQIQKVVEITGLTRRNEIVIHDFERKNPYSELSRFFGDYYDNEKAFKCRIENINPIVTVDIEPEDTRLSMTYLEGKANFKFDNIFQCVSYFENLINKAGNVQSIDRKSWGAADKTGLIAFLFGLAFAR